MASSSPFELSLDCKPHGGYSALLKPFGDQQMNDQTQMLELVLSRLEEERTKIDAFKRQLPLCMQLLTNAVEASRQQLNEYRANQGSKPAVEESDKANWMTSAQLWSQAGNDMEDDHKRSSKTENGGELTSGSDTTDGRTANTNSTGAVANSSQTQRKARRCWSPDLHRRFVNALQMLGGSQVATPKQIRELMKVEGLTNDEVKSHLQKYRLHTRKPSPSPQPAGPATPQLVVLGLGGIWVPPEYATAASVTHGGAPALYGAHYHHPVAPHAPPHLCASATPVPQEFYTAAAAPAPPSQLLHHQLHVYKAASQGHSSPESESNEDDKSESSSWKGETESGGDERKAGLAALREGEESNGSEITLKF